MIPMLLSLYRHFCHFDKGLRETSNGGVVSVVFIAFVVRHPGKRRWGVYRSGFVTQNWLNSFDTGVYHIEILFIHNL